MGLFIQFSKREQLFFTTAVNYFFFPNNALFILFILKSAACIFVMSNLFES